MELISIEQTRMVELLNAVRPQGQLHMATVIDLIREKFHFTHAPTSIEDISNGSLTFNDGISGTTAIEELSIFSDGIVLKSKSSSKSLDGILADLKKWAIDELGYQFVKTHEVDHFYTSELVFGSDADVLSALKTFEPTLKVLADELKKHSGFAASYEAFGFSFAVDPQSSLIKPTEFKVERKQGVKFDFNRFFSTAPLPTESHMKVLRALETAA